MMTQTGPAVGPSEGPVVTPCDWSSPASQVLLEELPGAVAVTDERLTYLAVNRRWLRELQLEGLPVVGRTHCELFPDLHPEWQRLYERCLAGAEETVDDELLVRPDQTQDWVRWEVRPWRRPEGTVGGLILTCTVRQGDRRAPSERAMERDLAASMLSAGGAPVLVVDAAGRVLRLNDAAAALTAGHACTPGVTFLWHVLVPAARREAARERLLGLLQAARTSGDGGAWPRPGGEALQPAAPVAPGFRWNIFPWHRQDGTFEGLCLMGLDAPESKAPDLMSQSEFRPSAADEAERLAFREIAEAAPFGMIVLTDVADVSYANPQHRSVLGFGVEDCGGLHGWLERALAADEEFRRRALDEWWERVWRRRTPWTCSLRNVDGILKEVEFRPAPLPDHRLLLTIFDVTDSRLEEQAVRASEARYRGLFQNCASGVAILNSSGNITEVNPVFESLAGCPRLELRRMGLSGLLPEADAEAVRRAAMEPAPGPDGPPREMPTTLTARDGRRIPVGLSLSVVRNEEGAPVYTALFLHPTAAAPATEVRPPAWHDSPLSRTIPDLVLLLDGAGMVLDHTVARDFELALAPGESLRGRMLDGALPAVAEALPLDVMMERLRENPAAETRCEFAAELVAKSRPRSIEARMILLSAPEAADARYGLVLRDVTAVATRGQSAAGPLPWLRNLSAAAILTNERGRITAMNPAAELLFGYTAEELHGSGLYRLFRPDDPRAFSEEISSRLNRARCWKERSPFHRKDGSRGMVDVELVPASDEAAGTRGFIAIIHEAVDPAAAVSPEAARPSVTLHRARNDLQVLSSLFSLQADKASVPDVREAVVAGKDRLAAVALIYRLITSETDTVDFARYSAELGRTLLESHRIANDRIQIETAFDAVRLPQKLAITLGLILQELLAASLDTFEPSASGVIRISLTSGAGEGVLIVRDNGTLLTEALRQRRLGSFSWQIVETLAGQIGGVLMLTSDLENQVRLRFRLAPPANAGV